MGIILTILAVLGALAALFVWVVLVAAAYLGVRVSDAVADIKDDLRN